MKKRILASLLSLCLLVGLLPTAALAVDETPDDGEAVVCTCEALCSEEAVDESCPVCAEDFTLCAYQETTADGDKNTYYEMDDVTDPAGPTAVEQLQERINALPTADELADMDADKQAEVYTEVSAIYDAINALTGDEADELNMTALEEAAEFFTQQIMPLEGETETASISYKVDDVTYTTKSSVTASTNEIKLTDGGSNSITLYSQWFDDSSIDITKVKKDAALSSIAETSGGNATNAEDIKQQHSALPVVVEYASSSTVTNGRLFAGWYMEDGTEFTINTPVTNNIVVTARFVNYSLDSNGTLTISGAGQMCDVDTGALVPWNSCKSSIKNVVIENGITKIGVKTLVGLGGESNAVSITIANSVTAIGSHAFYNSKLGTITIPSSVQWIGSTAFGLTAATSVTFSGDVEMPYETFPFGDTAPSISTITVPSAAMYEAVRYGGYTGTMTTTDPSVITDNNFVYALSGTTAKVLNYTGTDTTVTVPSSVASDSISYPVTAIGAGAFSHKSGVTVSLPTSITSVGKQAFYRTAKVLVEDRETVDTVKESFEDNPKNRNPSVEWAKANVTYNNLAFSLSADETYYIVTGFAENATDKTTINIPSEVNDIPVKSIANDAFKSATGVTSVTIAEGITSIGNSAFFQPSFSSIAIPSTVETIGELAFAGCQAGGTASSSLNAITFSVDSDTGLCSLKTIGANAFRSAFISTNGDVSIEIPESTSNITINASAFINNSAITKVNLSKSVTNIAGNYVFHSFNATAFAINAENVTYSGTTPLSAIKWSTVLYVPSESAAANVKNQTGNTSTNWTIANMNGGTVSFAEGTNETTGFYTPTKEGYTFGGWYSDSSFQTEATSVTTCKTYYAKWVSTITFDANGGSGTMNTQELAETDTTTALSTNTFTRDGYEFSGWNTEPDGTGTAYTAGATGAGKDGNVTLYAQWTKKIGESTNYTVNAIVDQTYTGAAIEPVVVVKNGDNVLSGGYTVTYSNNTNVGTAKVTVAIGTDTAEVEFKIVKDENPTVSMSGVSVTYGTAYTMTATAKTSAGNVITDGTITIQYYTDEDCKTEWTAANSETQPTDAGTYYAKAVLTETNNYATASKVAKITISNATFSVNATGYSGTYDGAAHSITVTADGANVTYSTDDTTYSSNKPTFTNAGIYTVYYKAEKANHDNVTGSVPVEITKALLTITADNQTVYVGGTLPEYTYTVSGLVGNDTEAVITTKPTMACSAQDANTAGSYPITPSGADAGNNYSIKYVDGTLTVADTGDGNAFKVETSALDDVPASLKETYKSPDELTAALKTEIRNANSSVSSSNIVVYDVTLMVNMNDGKGWVKADAEHFPANGKLTVTLPYPTGTNSSYTFTVVHMFTTNDFNNTPGDTERPTVRNTASGIQFEVTGLSPISVGWVAPTSSGGGGGGSSSSSYTVSVDSTRHGTVKSNRTSASRGTTVTLTVTPDDGYELDELTVTDKNGDTVKLTKSSDTKYTFTMPASKVTVEASFVEITDEPDEGLPFVDVAESAYYYDAVAWAVENGITGGTSATTFSPDQACTRAQAVTFLWRAAGSPEPETTSNPFTDVSTSDYYYDAVLWAVENGITAGTSATTFSPDNTCTRGQIVTFLYRAAGTTATGSNPFTDVADSAYYADAVKWAVAEGVTSGTSATTFSPDQACTRAQIVTFLYRANA